MIVYIVRHGIAASKADPDNSSDSARPLTGEGIQKTREVAEGLKRLKVFPDLVLTSPWLRARQTAEIVADVLDSSGRIQEMEELSGDRSVDDALQGLARYRSHDSVMLVGHQPLLGELTSYLLSLSRGMQMDLRKSGVCVIEVERIPPKSPGMLLWMMTPKQLRLLR